MNRTLHVLVTEEGHPQEIEVLDESLSQALFLSGHFLGRPLCSGLGRCGQCRVQFLSPPPDPVSIEKELLTGEEIRSGFRLACRHEVKGHTVVAVRPHGPRRRQLPKDISGPGLALAVDLGTTTIKSLLLGRAGDPVTSQEPNPQMGAGSEVLSRLSFALAEPSHALYLKQAVVDVLEEIAGDVGGVEALAVAGNSVMIHLLLGAPLEGLARAPYRLALGGGTVERISDTLPPTYIPPLLGPFIGADICAGLCSILQNGTAPAEYPFLFCDLGTNGEMVLGLGPDRFLATSVALGPALEGVGLTLGALAEPGVIREFVTGPDGIVPARSARSARISGTGYLSLLACLLRLGIVDEQGGFRMGETPLSQSIMKGYDQTRGRLDLSDGVFLLAADVEEILKVKAAFNAGTTALLSTGGVVFSEIRSIYLAGTFGEHVRTGDLLDLGFFPGQVGAKLIRAGNTSLKGAALLLRDMAARERAERLREQVSIIEMAGDPSFQDRFIRSMRFTHVQE
jgi:uncharacterized 2Fe-2S/4Fe-4S cluster protein (DUF4445 family)